MKASLLSLAASTLLAIGCTASGQVHTSAHMSAPDLVYINSNVQVIANHREPIFYTSNYYWRYDGGVWYRSSNHASGWIRIQVVPVAIRQISRPAAYVHYRGEARAETGNSREQHKAVQAAERQERKEEKQEAQQERREVKAEQKEERKQVQAEQKEERREAKAAHKADKK